MKRLLCIVGGMNAGGAETFLMKIYRGLDTANYQMDFAVAVDGVYDNEIKSMGGRIYHITPKSKGAVKNFFSIKNLVKEHQYKYVMRVSQHSLSSLELLAAKMGGAEVLAFRSSNSNTIGGKIDAMMHKLFMPLVKIVANVKIAPSTEAAEFMFGKGCIEKQNVMLLHNGLDTELYRYSEAKRKKIRKELGIEDKFVIGHVGRFSHQKNHEFLINIFAEIKKKRDDAVLLLAGKGELEEKIRNKVKQMGLDNSVLFLGVRSDIPILLSAMDVFVFPSYFEGMPNTVIEAQTSGLFCLISDSITKEAMVTKRVNMISLNQSASQWANEIIKRADIAFDRECIVAEMQKKGYEIKDCVEEFVKIVLEKGIGKNEISGQ